MKQKRWILLAVVLVVVAAVVVLLPTPVWTFLEEYDLTGKTIIPFFSHNGSSDGANSLNRLTELAKGAAVRTDDALSIRGGSVSGAETKVKN